ncbi:MAG: NTP transferase domain-containing protein [Dehalococcoidales bacterium]|nr:NTP transferase domain-containing protein [Dehalococcoidales bacterium]
MNNKTAVIIAGGFNKRIKMIKSLINLGGKQILIRINESIKDLFSDIILVIRKNQDDDIPDLGIALNMYIVEDIYPDKGPLSGIYSGIKNSINQKIFIIGGDYPFLSKEFIKLLLNKSKNNKSTFIKNNSIINPLHAVYIKNDWEKIFKTNLSEKLELSPKKIISKNKNSNNFLDYKNLKPHFKQSLFDIDTLEDLREAKKVIKRNMQSIRSDIRPEGI